MRTQTTAVVGHALATAARGAGAGVRPMTAVAPLVRSYLRAGGTLRSAEALLVLHGLRIEGDERSFTIGRIDDD